MKPLRPLTWTLLVALGVVLWWMMSEPKSLPPRLTWLLHDPPTTESRPDEPEPSVPALAPLPFEIELVHGRVVLASGQPLEGAWIRCDEETVCSNAAGEFALPRSRRTIRIEHPLAFPRQFEPPFAGSTETSPWPFVLFAATRIEGLVENQDGSPLAGATVEIGRSLGGRLLRVESDARGRWTSPPLEAGAYQMLVSHPRRVPAETTVVLDRPDESRQLRTRLGRGRGLRLLVFDGEARPLPDVRVWAEYEIEGRQDSIYLGRTGDLGTLEAEFPDPGARAVRLQLAGFVEARASIPAPAGDTDGRARIEARLDAAPALRARVVFDRSGLPARIESVRLERLGEYGIVPCAHSGVLFHSLPEGEVRVGVPPAPGSYRIEIEAIGRHRGVSPLIEFDGTNLPPSVVIRVAPAAELVARILDRGGPVSDARVELISAEDHPLYGPSRHGAETSDGEGRVVFPSPPDGLLRIQVEHAAHLPLESHAFECPPPPGAPREITLVLSRGGRIRGVVQSPEGQPIGELPVILADDPFARLEAGDRTDIAPTILWADANGRFEVSGLSPSRVVRIAVGTPESTPELFLESVDGSSLPRSVPLARLERVLESGRSIVTREDETLEITLTTSAKSPTSLRGVVLVDGRPFSSEVVLSAVDRPFAARTVRADADGRFTFSRLTPGAYRVVAPALAISQELEVGPDPSPEARLERQTLSLDVEVVSADGSGSLAAVATATLTRSSSLEASGDSRARQRAQLSVGRLRFVGLLPGEHRLRVEAPDHLPQETIVRLVESRSIRVPLEPGVATEIRLVAPDGSEYHGDVDVTVTQATGTAPPTDDAASRIVHRRRHRVDAILRLPLLPRGQYQVEIRTESGAIVRSKLRIGES